MLLVFFTLAIIILLFAICYGVIATFVLPKQKLNERLRSLDAQEQFADRYAEARSRRTVKEAKTFRERVLVPFEQKLGNILLNFAPKLFNADVERLLLVSGKRRVWSVQAFTIFRGVIFLLCVFLAIRYTSNKPDMIFIQSALVVFLGAVAGFILPILLLRSLAQARQKKIQRQLPEVFDLLCVSVQAGLSFDAAIKRIVEHMEGPFIDELRYYLEDMRMGLPRRVALKQVADRCDIAEVSLFATSLIQAERLGTGIGKTLSNQSANMRDRRRQEIKAEALKAPVKMLFPLVLFIFPAIFVVVLLPSVLSLINSFAK